MTETQVALVMTILGWIVLLLAVFGVIQHIRGGWHYFHECRRMMTAVDRELCHHYFQHEGFRLFCKILGTVLGAYFVARPLAVSDPTFGYWGPIAVRAVIAAILGALSIESVVAGRSRDRVAEKLREEVRREEVDLPEQNVLVESRIVAGDDPDGD
jgi:hypothetical protein